MTKNNARPPARKKALVLGVGNVLLRDEGAGVRTIEALSAGYGIPRTVVLADGGTGGAALVTLITKYRDVIIVDAVRGGGKPGSVYRFGVEELEKALPSRSSAHQIGVAEMVRIAAFEGFCPNVRVVGIEPADLTPGLELTDEVRRAIPKAAAAVAKELEKLGIKIEKKPVHARPAAAGAEKRRASTPKARPRGRGRP